MDDEGGRSPMTSRNESAESEPADDWLGDYRPFDVFEQFAEAQRLGLDAATSLMGRVTEMFTRVADGDGSTMDPSTWFGTRGEDETSTTARFDGVPRDEIRRLRAEATRSMDSVLEMARRLFESSLDLADSAVRRPNLAAWMTNAPAADTLAVHVAPGDSATATVWVHQREGVAIAKVRLAITPLRSARGEEPLVTAAFDPGSLLDVQPGESRAVHLHLDVSAECRPGTYWGLVLAEGMADLALPLRLDVRAASGEP
jgi:hypothetical protein